MAIDNARGDIILFLDDNAVAEERWMEKYENLFNSLPNVGGISGATYKAYVDSGKVVKTYECFYDEKPPKNTFYRKPLPEYVNYLRLDRPLRFYGRKSSARRCVSLCIAGRSQHGVAERRSEGLPARLSLQEK